MLNPSLKSTAERLLPRFLVSWLDPVQEIINSEVMSAAAKLREDQVVLDAGAGEAGHRKFFSRGRYLALDAGYGDPTWDYSGLDVRGNLESLPLRSHSVDCVLCLVVLEHTRNPRQALVEFARVLKRGGALHLVVPFLWEEHQPPNDFFRFTRYGVQLLFEGLPFQVDLLSPIGGFFWVCARRCVNLLGFFQGSWRWLLFGILTPFFGFLFPVIFYFLDWLDESKSFTLGFQVRATKEGS